MKKQTIIPEYDSTLLELVKVIELKGAKFSLCTLTEPQFTGGKACPFTGRVKKFEYRYSTWGGDYRTAIINNMIRYGGLTEAEAIKEFNTKECKSNYNKLQGLLEELKSDPRRLYIHLLQKQGDLVGNRTRYIIDGRFATAAETAEIKAATRKKNTNARLDAVNVAKEEQIVYNDIRLENVRYIKMGKILWKSDIGLNHPDQAKAAAQ